MVNVNNLSGGERLLIFLIKFLRKVPRTVVLRNYRVKRCCGRRPIGAGGVTVDGPPNRRSKNDGPDE
jgi:hypothetical protein